MTFPKCLGARSVLQSSGLLIILTMFCFCQSAESARPNSDSKQSASTQKVLQLAAVKDTATAKTTPRQETPEVIVYYFHGNARCPTCYKLENYAKSEVESDFADAIKTGKLEWQTVNVEEKGNEHFADEYKLYTKSVIVSIHAGEKQTSWKNLDKIWQLVQDESKYRVYIKTEVEACLAGKCL